MGAVQIRVAKVVQQHAYPRLAVRRLLGRQAGIDVDGVETNPLKGQNLQQEIVGPLKVGFRESVGSEAVLIGHHDEAEAGLLESEQRRNRAGHEAQLVKSIDLFVFGFLDQAAVPVDEKNFSS